MRVAGELHVEWVNDEAVVLDGATGNIHYLNPPAALAFALLQEHGFERGVAEITSRIEQSEGNPAELEHLLQEMIDKRLILDD